jgi:hypothetical protein
MKDTVFWDVMPCSLMECAIISEELAASIRVLFYPVGGSRFL